MKDGILALMLVPSLSPEVVVGAAPLNTPAAYIVSDPMAKLKYPFPTVAQSVGSISSSVGE